MKLNVDKFIAGVHKYLADQLTPLAGRLRTLEERPAPEKGDPGEKGDRGETGKCGDSVTMEDVAPLLEEIIDQRVSEIPTPEKGDPGEKGDRGEAGNSVTIEDCSEAIEAIVTSKVSEIPAPKDGENGKSVDIEEIKTLLQGLVDALPAVKDGQDGKSVDVEDLRPMLQALVSEIPKAIDGTHGKDGAPGRDALDIEILPSVDFERSYPRGTYALSDGGVIRSYSQTDGKRGWETVWRGVAKVEVVQKDFRNFTIKTTLGDGPVCEETFTIPSVLDRGVYKPEGEYSKGDATTFGGSLWIAQVDEPAGKPGVSKDWRLAVKHGRNGRDGDKGPKGEKGDTGTAGKDGRDLTQMDSKGNKW